MIVCKSAACADALFIHRPPLDAGCRLRFKQAQVAGSDSAASLPLLPFKPKLVLYWSGNRGQNEGCNALPVLSHTAAGHGHGELGFRRDCQEAGG